MTFPQTVTAAASPAVQTITLTGITDPHVTTIEVAKLDNTDEVWVNALGVAGFAAAGHPEVECIPAGIFAKTVEVSAQKRQEIRDTGDLTLEVLAVSGGRLHIERRR